MKVNMVNMLVKVTNPKWDTHGWYDKYDSFIVVVKSHTDVYKIVCEKWGVYNFKSKERKEPEGWENLDVWQCEVLGKTDAKVGPIMGSFNAA